MKAEIDAALEVLKRGGIILYPTDTIWGLGCDATNAEAIDRIYKLKQRAESKSMICLVSDFKMLNQFVQTVPEVAYDILKYAIKPTTIVYDDPIRVAENVVAADNTLGIRVVQDEFCRNLIRKFKRPIVSTSANISDRPAPSSFDDISPEIIEGVDYAVNWNRSKKNSRPSAIIKLGKDGTVTVIRN